MRKTMKMKINMEYSEGVSETKHNLELYFVQSRNFKN